MSSTMNGSMLISTPRNQRGIARPSLSILPKAAKTVPQVLHQDIPAEARRTPPTRNPTHTKPTTTLMSNPTPRWQHVSRPKKMSVLAALREVGTPCKITRTPHCHRSRPAISSKSFLRESKREVSLASCWERQAVRTVVDMVVTNTLRSNNNMEGVTLSSRLTHLKDMANLHTANPHTASLGMVSLNMVAILLSNSTTSNNVLRSLVAVEWACWEVRRWVSAAVWSVECCLRMPFRTMIRTSMTKVINKDRTMAGITAEEMMVVEETFKWAVGVENDTYEFPLIFCMQGFHIGRIFGKLRSYGALRICSHLLRIRFSRN